MELAILELFLLTFLWYLLDVYGLNSSLTSTQYLQGFKGIPKILNNPKLNLTNFKQNNQRVLVSGNLNRQLEGKEIGSSEINQKMLDMTTYPVKSITPLIVQKTQKEQEKEQKEAEKRYYNLLKFLKRQIHHKRVSRPKLQRTHKAAFNSDKVYVTKVVDWMSERNEEIVFHLFENLPESLQTKKVAKQAVNMVLVLDEIGRILEYDTAITGIEQALEEEEGKKQVEDNNENKDEWKNKEEKEKDLVEGKEEKRVEDKVKNKAEEDNKEEEILEENEKMEIKSKEDWKNGKGPLNILWLKLILFGILNISGPGDVIDERLIEAFERLNKANTFVCLLNENNEYRIELENGVKNCEDLLKRAAKILHKYNNFRPSYFQPINLDKYKIIGNKNKKETVFIDKQPYGGYKNKKENWLEEKLKINFGEEKSDEKIGEFAEINNNTNDSVLADEKKIEQIIKDVNVKKGFDEGEG